jgi:curved DNA-binding protein CbpA
MSSKLEQVLELLINEEREAAEELLHDFIVENARQIHEDLLNESDEVVEEELEELDEADDILSDEEEASDELESDASEIENEEFYDEDEMEDDEALDDLEMGDEAESEDGVEARVDDLESALAELEAEFEKIMSGEDDADEMDAEDEAEDDMEESFELELDESEDEDLEEGEELDLEESDDDADEDEDLNEYVTPVSASAGDNGDNTSSTVNANPKRPGDDSNAAPVKANDGNTSGGKGDAPKDMGTKNVNVSGNSKSPAMSNQAAKPGDNGVNNKSITS